MDQNEHFKLSCMAYAVTKLQSMQQSLNQAV